jgi:hypothetical protein
MDNGDEVVKVEPDPRCDHKSRRVIRLRWPYAEANLVRARLISDTGSRFEVSPLYEMEGGWAFSICRECAQHGVLALAVFLAILAVP